MRGTLRALCTIISSPTSQGLYTHNEDFIASSHDVLCVDASDIPQAANERFHAELGLILSPPYVAAYLKALWSQIADRLLYNRSTK